MQSQAKTVDQYLSELSDDRRELVQVVREEILRNLPDGYEEGMQYGMIGYYVPHSLYPAGYHCNPQEPLPFLNLASQKQYVSVYLYCVYSDEREAEWFRGAWEKTGKKLNMGKSCVRIRRRDEFPENIIGQAVSRTPVAKFIASYEAATDGRRSGQRRAAPKKKAAAKRQAAAKNKPAARNSTGKKKR